MPGWGGLGEGGRGRVSSSPGGLSRGRPGQVGPGRTGLGRVSSSPGGLSRGRPGQVGPGRTGLGRVRSDRDRLGQVEPGWAGARQVGPGRAGQGQVGPGRTGVGRASRAEPRRVRSDRGGLGRDKPGRAGLGRAGANRGLARSGALALGPHACLASAAPGSPALCPYASARVYSFDPSFPSPSRHRSRPPHPQPAEHDPARTASPPGATPCREPPPPTSWARPQGSGSRLRARPPG